MGGYQCRQRRALGSGALMLPIWFLLSFSTLGEAADDNPLDCSKPFPVDVGGAQRYFDLSSLAGEHYLSRWRDTPPTRMNDEVRFDLCADVPPKEDVDSSEQCPSGTRACVTMTNQKDSHNDRIIAVIPVATSSNLQPEFVSLSNPHKGLNVILHGGMYPPNDPIPQYLNISILCDTTMKDPTLVRYNGMELNIEWYAPSGCAYAKDEPPSGGGGGKEEDSEGDGSGGEKVGSGVGWFFLLLFLAFVAYFVIGAYYNYSTYGASGADLIPHRDFWQEVPYIIRDIVSHLFSAIRPSSRSGYIAV